VIQSFPATDLAHPDLAGCAQDSEQHSTVSGAGSTVRIWMRRGNASFSGSIASVVLAASYCDGSRRLKGDQPIAGLLHAVRDGAAFQPPLARGKVRCRLVVADR